MFQVGQAILPNVETYGSLAAGDIQMSKSHISPDASTAREALHQVRRRPLGPEDRGGELLNKESGFGIRGEEQLRRWAFLSFEGTKPISRKWVWIVRVLGVGRVRFSPLRPQRGDAEVR